MYYSKSKIVENRTVNYRFSIEERGQDDLLDLKKIVVLHNQEQKQVENSGKDPHYIEVRVRARGPRREGKIQYWGYTPEHLATHYDVYLVRNTARMNKYHKSKVSSNGTLKSFITDKIGKLDQFVNGSAGQTV